MIFHHTVLFFSIFRVTVNCSKDWHNVHIYKDRTILLKMFRPKRDDEPLSGLMLENRRRKRSGKTMNSQFYLYKCKKKAHNFS